LNFKPPDCFEESNNFSKSNKIFIYHLLPGLNSVSLKIPHSGFIIFESKLSKTNLIA